MAPFLGHNYDVLLIMTDKVSWDPQYTGISLICLTKPKLLLYISPQDKDISSQNSSLIKIPSTPTQLCVLFFRLTRFSSRTVYGCIKKGR